MTIPEPVRATLVIADAFERLGIPYYLTGSLASSLHGMPRATQDADLVADMQQEHIEPVVRALTGPFYIDAEMVRDAVERRSSFNVIHLDTMFKVDVFVLAADQASRQMMQRRRRYDPGGPGSQALYVASAEDTILHKLYWYRLGGCVSERQWMDVLGVLHVQGETLDLQYLRSTARMLEVGTLLEDALGEAAEGGHDG